MRNFKYQLANKRFGMLVALSRTSCPKTHRTAWLCKCDCGATKIILQQSLLSGGSRSCGCGIGKAARQRREKKIQKGSRFGKLKVLHKEGQDKWGNWLYKCRCDCGKIHLTMGTTLRCNMAKSCGCGQKTAVTKHGKSQTKEYRREKAIQNTTKRRAAKRNLGESFSSEEITKLLIDQNNRCHYCKEFLSAYHRDHKIPLCRDGGNTIENVALTCPPCNLKKNRKTEEEFCQFLESEQGAQWLLDR